jgi:hypothetical protein
VSGQSWDLFLVKIYMQQLAVMSIEKGEKIMSMLVGGHIPGTGRYKLIAKKKTSGLIEWAHYKERDNGMKEKVFRGEARNMEELDILTTVMNENLRKIFGDHAAMEHGCLDGAEQGEIIGKVIN